MWNQSCDDVPDDALVDLSIRAALDRCREARRRCHQDRGRVVARRNGCIPSSIALKLSGLRRPGTAGHNRRVVSQSLCRRVMAQPAFSGRLQPFRESSKALWNVAAAQHPLPPADPAAPAPFRDSLANSVLITRMRNVVCALQLAAHRNQSKDTIETRVKRYIGASRSDSDTYRPGLLKGSQTKHRSGTRST